MDSLLSSLIFNRLASVIEGIREKFSSISRNHRRSLRGSVEKDARDLDGSNGP